MDIIEMGNDSELAFSLSARSRPGLVAAKMQSAERVETCMLITVNVLGWETVFLIATACQGDSCVSTRIGLSRREWNSPS